MKIITKSEMYELYEAGEFGNRLRVYTVDELFKLETCLPIGLRYKGTPGTLLPFYSTPCFSHTTAIYIASLWLKMGLSPDLISVSESTSILPGFGACFQGEVMQSENYLDLYYTHHPDIMRKALVADPHYATGIKALTLLQFFMDSPSYDNLLRLLKEYDGAVIEFSVFPAVCGVLGYNTVFWEVRHY